MDNLGHHENITPIFDEIGQNSIFFSIHINICEEEAPKFVGVQLGMQKNATPTTLVDSQLVAVTLPCFSCHTSVTSKFKGYAISPFFSSFRRKS